MFKKIGMLLVYQYELARNIGMENRAIARLIKHFGTQVATASALGVAQPTVSDWLKNRYKISAFYALKAEQVTGGKVKATSLCQELKGVMPRRKETAA